VIAVDTNILVYAHRKDSLFHEIAKRAIASLAEHRAAWAIPWPCAHEFFSVVTNSRIYQTPTPPSDALDQIDAWLESSSVVLLSETDQYLAELRALVTAGRIAGARIHDARIAALCRQHGVRELWSADRDFSRFPDLNVTNPLVR
jgi:uncharacterized protein